MSMYQYISEVAVSVNEEKQLAAMPIKSDKRSYIFVTLFY